MKKFLALIIILLIPCGRAKADIIIFNSGSAKVGVIEEETPQQVKLRVKDVVVGVSRSNIERIEYSTPAENEKLLLKWKEEKQQLEAQRKKRREAEKKFEAEQRAKGLVNVDGKWMSAGEAEARRQQRILQEVQSRQEPSSPTVQPEESQELELPEGFEDLADEDKEIVIEEVKRQQQVQVGQVQVVTMSGGRLAAVKGVVTNGGNVTAKRIDLEIDCFDVEGELLDSKTATILALKPGESGSFYTALGIDAELVNRAVPRVTSVTWQ